MDENLEFIKKSDKVYFVAMNEELDADCTKRDVVYTGVGKARATRGILKWMQSNQDMLERGWKPLIISIGTAGSGKHNRGDIIIVERFTNNGDSFIRETLDFKVLPKSNEYICASSDFFISDKNFDAGHVHRMRGEFDCMDMESFAIANICAIFNLPFVAIKCISDGANDTVESFDEMLPKFRAQLNQLVQDLD